jgi:hypothetical protein
VEGKKQTNKDRERKKGKEEMDESIEWRRKGKK